MEFVVGVVEYRLFLNNCNFLTVQRPEECEVMLSMGPEWYQGPFSGGENENSVGENKVGIKWKRKILKI